MKDAPIFFANQAAFRVWLAQHYDSENELLVGFYKISTGKPSMTWSESVDEALCFGWIDGVRKSIDNESYSIRFTPRKRTSIWSAININKVQELTAAGLMTDAGQKAFSFRTENKSKVYAHEAEAVSLDAELEAHFKKNKQAWFFFNAQTNSYKKMMTHWIMSAKQEKTKLSRLDKTIAESEMQRKMNTR